MSRESLPGQVIPFDHLLMARAMAEGAHFVSQDQNVALYGIPFVTCSDPVGS
ncbi:hypothetical protein SM0020_29080 [Sinorhizobium meliloti CCNWSX0020]|uniref:PilT protein domain-containing protein n=1 Tax=Sinorhizobium meliloti CCNWSX0020 TaxID=1107881 RepID=H0G8H7_RHIML|nr:hypothetical protein [Sinorhizobium meliloti]EHK74379.1 hypothetical protein SM0020_29080 [Sinorhizobium meliloti CCNWSX0020]